jgi:hypothetical protein
MSQRALRVMDDDVEAGGRPVSADYDDDLYVTHRRMHDEAPVYYSEQYDWYTLSRHDGVGRAVHRCEGISL